MMGWSAGLLFWNDGGAGNPGGQQRRGFAKWPSARPRRRRRYRGPDRTAGVIWVLPVELVEVIASRPAMVVNCRSSGVATADAMVAGSAPGKLALHLDGREIDARQIAHRQAAVSHHAEQRDARHQQAGGDRPPNEDL